MRTHQELDQRSLEMHRRIAEKISRDPILFERVKQTLKRWHTLVPPASRPYLEEWQRLVDAGMETCLAVATEDSRQAAALRQSSPFVDILSHQERFAFLRSWSEEHAAQGS